MMRHASLYLFCSLVAGCASQPLPPSAQHLQQTTTVEARSDIPPILKHNLSLPPIKPQTKVETYSVVVNNVPAQEILFALARDAKINLDIHPGIQGNVTLNALQQTLPQILQRISKQVDMRYELNQGNLIVMPDTPYLQHYKIDYVNMARDMESTLNNSMQVSSGGNQSGVGNNSSIAIKDTSKNRFWETLVQNIKDILRENGSSNTDLPVIANPENGLLMVRANRKQHEKIQETVDQILSSARRQVMIETTIVEVRLNNEYHQGINWSALIQANGKSFKLMQHGETNFGNGMFGVITNPTPLSVNHQLALLESFGNVKVLSSPKLSVLNNQTAMMRVVDNLVYFTIKADTVNNHNSATVTTYTTTPNTLPVGFTMSVTPQISDNDEVLLNIKPSISRLIQYVPDPNPNLLNMKYQGVPEIQTREMESLMRLENNQIAVMGGLMQDRSSQVTDAIPGLSKIPAAGELFTQRNHHNEKTELVIFLRPVIIKQSSLVGDFKGVRELLPTQDFFKRHENM